MYYVMETLIPTVIFRRQVLDIIIMMLGSNDLKEFFHASIEDIAAGVETLVKDIIEFSEDNLLWKVLNQFS